MPKMRAICWGLLAVTPVIAPPVFAAEEAVFNDQVLPFVKKFCLDCHTGSEAEAGLSFDTVGHVSHVDDHPDLWEDIADKLRQREMPPADQPQPSAQEIRQVESWIASRMARLVKGQKPNPGRVTMRRLNRFEYNNTIRDLLGIDFRPADDFPADDTGYGFDNIGDVLTLPPLLMEKYLTAAEQVVDKAIVENASGEKLVEIDGVQLRGGSGPQGTFQRLNSEGVLEADVNIPSRGLFEIVVNAFGDQAGSDPVRMSVRVDDQEVRLVDVKATSDQQLGEYAVPWQLKEGNHKIGLAFVNDFYDPQADNSDQRDRNLIVAKLSLRFAGEKAWESLPEPHRRVILRAPKPGNHDQLARESIHRFAHRAFRRPVEGDDVKRIFRLHQQAVKDGATFEQGMKVALTAILVSPHFLFRVEIDRDQKAPDGVRSLNEFELANRLSYFLWSSMPDNLLFDAARMRALSPRENFREQFERMLADPKASALVESFIVQWLQLRKLGMISPDPDRFVGCTSELLAEMRQETELFAAEIIRENRPITDLLDADFTYLNERLAKHYGIDGVQGTDFRRVSVSRETRGGILTHASVLTLTSNPTRTSPVKRGKWVLENVLGAPPPPPPPGVPDLPEEGKTELTGTLRQRLEQHRAPNACGSCHSRIDPLGFGLENYDAVGRWRTHDGESVVDASGVLPDGTSFKGPQSLKQVLLGRKEEFARALAERLLTYAIGRGLTRADRPALDKIVATTVENQYKFKDLLLAVVESDPFQKRLAEDMP